MAAASAGPAAPGRRGRAALVPRFSGAERALHWLFALDIALLTLSGLGLYLRPGLNPVLDRRQLMHDLHLDAAYGLLLLPLLIAAARPGTLAGVWRDVEVFTADDWAWLRSVWLPGFLRRRPLPPQGRFNAGQKLNTIAVAAATAGFVATGVVMDVGAHLPPSYADAADTWHVWLMVLGAPLVAGHLVLALLVPSTRPAMRGILLGSVRLDFARRRHARWADEIAPPDRAHPPPGPEEPAPS